MSIDIRKGDNIVATANGSCPIDTKGICLGIGSIDSEKYLCVETEDGKVVGPILADGWSRLNMSTPASEEVKKFLNGIVGVVEATSYEHLSLWKEFHLASGEQWEEREDF